MSTKPVKKDNRGRKKVLLSERKVAVNIYVPKKNKKKAQQECDVIEAKYKA